jgi:hypothetical protein
MAQSIGMPGHPPTIVAPLVEPESLVPEKPESWLDAEVEVTVATYQAYQILYYTFIVVFALAGLDKFLHAMTQWERYVSPSISSILHLSAGAIVLFAGLIEMLAAAAVALKPRIGSWVVSAWLWLIAINLLTVPLYDMVLLVLALSAAGLAFTRLSAECN